MDSKEERALISRVCIELANIGSNFTLFYNQLCLQQVATWSVCVLHMQQIQLNANSFGLFTHAA